MSDEQDILPGTTPTYPKRQACIEERQIDHAERLASLEAQMRMVLAATPRYEDTAAKQDKDDGRRSVWNLLWGGLAGAVIVLFDKLMDSAS